MGRLIIRAGEGILSTIVLMCGMIDRKVRVKTLHDARPLIFARAPQFTVTKILIPSYNMALTPWKDWSADQVPSWWQSILAMKKDPVGHGKEGNYWNVLHAVSGLLCAVLYYHRQVNGSTSGIDSTLAPKVFVPKAYDKLTNHLPGWNFSLPE